MSYKRPKIVKSVLRSLGFWIFYSQFYASKRIIVGAKHPGNCRSKMIAVTLLVARLRVTSCFSFTPTSPFELLDLQLLQSASFYYFRMPYGIAMDPPHSGSIVMDI